MPASHQCSSCEGKLPGQHTCAAWIGKLVQCPRLIVIDARSSNPSGHVAAGPYDDRAAACCCRFRDVQSSASGNTPMAAAQAMLGLLDSTWQWRLSILRMGHVCFTSNPFQGLQCMQMCDPPYFLAIVEDGSTKRGMAELDTPHIK